MTIKEQVAVGFHVLKAVADTIRESGSAPAGIIYAALSAHGCSLQVFERIVGFLESEDLIRRDGDTLTWIA